jgi:hypothetical protein
MPLFVNNWMRSHAKTARNSRADKRINGCAVIRKRVKSYGWLTRYGLMRLGLRALDYEKDK